MLITVNRILSDSDTTLSIISIDGKFFCFGLEDEYRETKIPSETRIPAGIYHIKLRKEGGFNSRYQNKFPEFHEGMLQIDNVPNFEYVLIHIGNTDEDTAGCLLVGKNANTSGELSIGNSTTAYKQLYKKVIESAKNNDLTIQYIDSDRM